MLKTKDFNGEVLKNLREKADLSQEKLVVELSKAGFEITKQTIYKWENGITSPNVNDLVIVASFFKVPIQEFFK